MEQMNPGYQETHASSLATPAGAVSHFVSSDDHQASPPACLMDMGNIALDGDDRPRVKVNGKTEPQRRWPPRQQSGQHSQGGDDQIVVPVAKPPNPLHPRSGSGCIHAYFFFQNLILVLTSCRLCDQRVTLHCKPSNLNMQEYMGSNPQVTPSFPQILSP
ncbi:Hypothetical protein SMAX5B_020022 [Scophthalmus maximus]|uniref:Uncharacterized protein n=1 Tax=Scophthalmus maximus TaxID=52904 RepID=A0A2U9B9G3_SCOMX|nr:Hypothetical protein SMAX5B_020022 [Scophthalmus maximus]